MFGDGYIAQHIVQYIKRENKDELYRIYLTDSLKIIAENTAKFVGGKSLTKRYYDIISDKKSKPEKSPEQIIDEVTKNAGLEVIDDG